MSDDRPTFTLDQIAAALHMASPAQAAHAVVNAPAPAPPPPPAAPSYGEIVAALQRLTPSSQAAVGPVDAATALRQILGLQQQPSQSMAPPPAPPMNAPTAPAAPPPVPPAPNQSIVTDRPVDILKWDRDMIQRYVTARGGNARDLSDPRNAKIWEEIATVVRAAAANVTIGRR